MNVAIVGAGSWGSAVATVIGDDADVVLWARRTELAGAIEASRQNLDYLPGFELPERVHATDSLEAALGHADVVVMAVPSHGFRAVFSRAADLIDPSLPIVSLTKGIEQESLMRMTQVIQDVAPGHDFTRVGVLTGPNLAKEVAAGQPAAAVIAMEDGDTAARLQRLFMRPTFRVYTNRDVVGCEAAGALKNVMAIAAGMAHGLGFGDNTKATLITRAIAEITRLGVALGGNPMTFAGLAGMGDLIATCMSDKSRNHRVGYGLGQGRSLDEIIGEMNMVAEGVKTTSGVLALADRHGVEMPIAVQVGRVLYEGVTPAAAVAELMGREAKPEMQPYEPA
jgi:glycerol-3-phosphate dehydrogenase (NAD(P)+)